MKAEDAINLNKEYKLGFNTNIESDVAPPGLNEDTIRFISAKKGEPEWMVNWRLDAFEKWKRMEEPNWAEVGYPKIDYQKISYYASPKSFKDGPKSLDEVDPEILRVYEKLGIPLVEQKQLQGIPLEDGEKPATSNMAVDAVFDSVSVATTFKKELEKHGIIFCSITEAIKEYPNLVKQYLGSVVPKADNYFACLNSAVFTDGTFVYVPKGVKCPMELTTYFRINERNTGQFERTLIIAEDDSYVSYLEGCSAVERDENQLHAAVVELVTHDNAEIKYSTVQNWFPGDENGKGGIYNFVTKRALCSGVNSKVMWTQVETGSAITWKYPSCILKGDNSIGEFYSVAITNNAQQADTGTKMIHIGKNTRSRVVSKGVSAGNSRQTYRGLVSIKKGAVGAKNKTQCDSMILGDKCIANTIPYIENENSFSKIEHEATVSKVDEEKLFYLMQRGISEENAVALLVTGFCKEVMQVLPAEFAYEAAALIELSVEGAVG